MHKDCAQHTVFHNTNMLIIKGGTTDASRQIIFMPPEHSCAILIQLHIWVTRCLRPYIISVVLPRRNTEEEGRLHVKSKDLEQCFLRCEYICRVNMRVHWGWYVQICGVPYGENIRYLLSKCSPTASYLNFIWHALNWEQSIPSIQQQKLDLGKKWVWWKGWVA